MFSRKDFFLDLNCGVANLVTALEIVMSQKPLGSSVDGLAWSTVKQGDVNTGDSIRPPPWGNNQMYVYSPPPRPKREGDEEPQVQIAPKNDSAKKQAASGADEEPQTCWHASCNPFVEDGQISKPLF